MRSARLPRIHRAEWDQNPTAASSMDRDAGSVGPSRPAGLWCSLREHRGLAGPMGRCTYRRMEQLSRLLGRGRGGKGSGPGPARGTACPGESENRGDVSERHSTPGELKFSTLAEPLLEQAGVTRSTMMGFPCLCLDGDFFASCDHRPGNLVVKLDEPRVSELVEAGKAEVFAPSGRPFREWASIPVRRPRSWAKLLDDALQCAASRRAGERRTRDRRR